MNLRRNGRMNPTTTADGSSINSCNLPRLNRDTAVTTTTSKPKVSTKKDAVAPLNSPTPLTTPSPPSSPSDFHYYDTMSKTLESMASELHKSSSDNSTNNITATATATSAASWWIPFPFTTTTSSAEVGDSDSLSRSRRRTQVGVDDVNASLKSLREEGEEEGISIPPEAAVTERPSNHHGSSSDTNDKDKTTYSNDRIIIQQQQQKQGYHTEQKHNKHEQKQQQKQRNLPRMTVRTADDEKHIKNDGGEEAEQSCKSRSKSNNSDSDGGEVVADGGEIGGAQNKVSTSFDQMRIHFQNFNMKKTENKKTKKQKKAGAVTPFARVMNYIENQKKLKKKAREEEEEEEKEQQDRQQREQKKKKRKQQNKKLEATRNDTDRDDDGKKLMTLLPSPPAPPHHRPSPVDATGGAVAATKKRTTTATLPGAEAMVMRMTKDSFKSVTVAAATATGSVAPAAAPSPTVPIFPHTTVPVPSVAPPSSNSTKVGATVQPPEPLPPLLRRSQRMMPPSVTVGPPPDLMPVASSSPSSPSPASHLDATPTDADVQHRMAALEREWEALKNVSFTAPDSGGALDSLTSTNHRHQRHVSFFTPPPTPPTLPMTTQRLRSHGFISSNANTVVVNTGGQAQAPPAGPRAPPVVNTVKHITDAADESAGGDRTTNTMDSMISVNDLLQTFSTLDTFVKTTLSPDSGDGENEGRGNNQKENTPDHDVLESDSNTADAGGSAGNRRRTKRRTDAAVVNVQKEQQHADDIHVNVLSDADDKIPASLSLSSPPPTVPTTTPPEGSDTCATDNHEHDHNRKKRTGGTLRGDGGAVDGVKVKVSDKIPPPPVLQSNNKTKKKKFYYYSKSAARTMALIREARMAISSSTPNSNNNSNYAL